MKLEHFGAASSAACDLSQQGLHGTREAFKLFGVALGEKVHPRRGRAVHAKPQQHALGDVREPVEVIGRLARPRSVPSDPASPWLLVLVAPPEVDADPLFMSGFGRNPARGARAREPPAEVAVEGTIVEPFKRPGARFVEALPEFDGPS